MRRLDHIVKSVFYGGKKMAVYLNLDHYNSEIREIAHFNGYIIINQSYWYPESKYTEEEAKEKFLNRDKQ